MATDPALPPSLRRELDDIRREIATLRTANRLQSSSIQGGALIVLDDDGNEIGTFGELPTGEEGLRVRSEAGTESHLLVDQLGFTLPYIPHVWRSNTMDPISVAVSDWTTAWMLTVGLCSGPAVEFQVLIAQPAGTECEVRLQRNSTGAVIENTIAVTATNQTLFFRGNHTIPVRTVAFATLNLQVRRTAGAGTVLVHWPSEGSIGGLLGGTIGWS